MREPYKMEAHGPWIPMSRVGKQRCAFCGLVALNNPLTDWAITKGCNYEDHPQHKSMVKKFGGKK